MKKILFVCMGNICRSPMAEGVVREEFKKRGIKAELDSAGTGAWHTGEKPDYRARQELKKHGISIDDLRARKFRVEDFDKFDHIYTMDSGNYSDILMLARDQNDAAKVDMFMNISQPGKNISVPDPYYNDGFGLVYDMIKETAVVLADKIERDEL
jgi:protein-tyrosine phosphatase